MVARAGTGTTQFISDGVEGLIAADDAGSAAALIRLARDRELLNSLSAHNASTAPSQTWPAVLEQVRVGYAEALKRIGK
ncbi:unannotated protein [freshwater metagenome]|uniref:Unannotated protein n=1 Tax=freshwater metagenome TaxID=449393 RepID=A0A6J6MFD3_9ZZZZ|nr:hypothetical protein [Actinomycetota bacterium]